RAAHRPGQSDDTLLRGRRLRAGAVERGHGTDRPGAEARGDRPRGGAEGSGGGAEAGGGRRRPGGGAEGPGAGPGPAATRRDGPTVGRGRLSPRETPDY